MGGNHGRKSTIREIGKNIGSEKRDNISCLFYFRKNGAPFFPRLRIFELHATFFARAVWLVASQQPSTWMEEEPTSIAANLRPTKQGMNYFAKIDSASLERRTYVLRLYFSWEKEGRLRKN